VAGFREFVTGEVLTAGNVDDFLAKQAVMKFADAAARDAALGTAVAGGNALRQGMVAYLDDVDDVLKYDGTAWTTVRNAGIGSNVVSTQKTDSFTTTSGSFVAVDGLSATITPTKATSKILVFADFTFSNSSNDLNSTFVTLFRGATDLGTGTIGVKGGRNVLEMQQDAAVMLLDSPATASATTYEIRIKVDGGTGRINQRPGGASRGTSRITLVEVAA
jgi:hypothetical protein